MGNEVNIVVKSKDESGPGLASAHKRVNDMGSTIKEMGKKSAEFITANVVEAGAEKVKEFVGESVSAFSNLNESLNAVNKIFGSSQGIILNWGKTTANSYGLSQRAFNDLAVPLGAGLKNAGIPLKDTANLTIELTKRASDMASVFNTSVPEALDAIQSGLRGESDPLERYGVGLTAAKVQAEALTETHKKSAKGLTTQELALARVNLIMKQTKSTQGDFVSTSGQLANAERIASAKTEELQAKIGQQLQPAVLLVTKAKLKLVDVIASQLLPALIRFGNWMKEHTTTIEIIAAMIAGVLVSAFVSWAAAAAAAAFATLVAVAPFVAMGAAIGLLVLGFIKAWNASSTFRSIVTNTIAVVGKAILLWAKVVVEEFKFVADVWLTMAGVILKAAAKAFGWVPGVGPKLKAAAAGFDDFKDGVNKSLNAAIHKTDQWSDAVDRMPNAIKFKGDIKDLSAKIAAAQAKLKTVPKSKQSAIRADIAQMLRQLQIAKDKLAQLHDKTVTLHILQKNYGGAGQGLGVLAPGKATGGIIGAATGGIRGGLVMVGEQGRELAELPYGTRVYPHGTTEAMMAGSGGGGASTFVLQSSGSRVDDLLLEILRTAIRKRGGNAQIVLSRA